MLKKSDINVKQTVQENGDVLFGAGILIQERRLINQAEIACKALDYCRAIEDEIKETLWRQYMHIYTGKLFMDSEVINDVANAIEGGRSNTIVHKKIEDIAMKMAEADKDNEIPV